MIVCSCNVLSDHAVRGCIGGPECPRTPAQVYRCLGCSPQCGRCAVTIRKMLQTARPGGESGSACGADCAAGCPHDLLANALESAIEDARAAHESAAA